MNAKKIVLGLSSIMFLSSIALAQPAQNCEPSNCGMQKQEMQGCGCKMKGNKDGMKAHKKHHKGSPFIGAVMRLDLSDAQRTQIKEIMKNSMKNRVKISDAFSETGFDKALFIKLSEQRKANKIQNEANMIEAVYKVLTPEQKKELKQNKGKHMKKDKMQRTQK
ncbi:Spy/CpxP family protein refolding chaperone [Sulfurimonas sp.]|uniref:Spy/CpxP family protein refolding chaperone n=1 Tax=Sulfurimonas sp. TaxID=2022749 RepID=UPI003D0CC82B